MIIAIIVSFILLVAADKRLEGSRFTAAHPTVLRRLRWGSKTLPAMFFVASLAYNLAAVHRSREQIRSWVYSSEDPLTVPEFHLHTMHTGSFCGNARAEQRYWLYGEAAAEGIDDPDPLVRARSVQAEFAVCNFLVSDRSGPYDRVLDIAKSDPEPIVRQVADDAPESNW